MDNIGKLYEKTLKGQWDEILRMYKSSSEVRTAKMAQSKETVLHIAVSDGYTNIAMCMVEICDEDSLEIVNSRGNTALHIAAAFGNYTVCKGMLQKNPRLIFIRNLKGETALFRAAVNGWTNAFLYLHHISGQEYGLSRRNDGDTILHVAISGEYFCCAAYIIRYYPKLADSVNENGLSPLHILASMPSVFRSGAGLGFIDRIIYHCVDVDIFEDEKIEDIEEYAQTRITKEKRILNVPENYKTIMSFFSILLSNFGTNTSCAEDEDEDEDEENPQRKRSSQKGINPFMSQESEGRRFPPNYDTLVLLLSSLKKILLCILKTGFWRIRKIQRMKQLHVGATLVMKELVKKTTMYKLYGNAGLDPPPDPSDPLYEVENCGGQEYGSTAKHVETPMLLAAKMGVVEMVDEILNNYPVAIGDLDSENKNVVLLAVENRQQDVYIFLLRSMIFPETTFRQLDNEGNSALHLAATLGVYCSGDMMLMQQEIAFFKYVKYSMPRRFISRYNNKKETPEELFDKTHKELVKDANDWLTKTSESCSVVAAVVASVAFATSTTVPGGNNEETGKATLKDQPAFDAFALSSLFALCSSVTALVLFLSTVSSRHRFNDFEISLPRKLVFAFTALFTSIASMLVSFFNGQTFILSDELRHIAYPLYGALCLPLALFALAQLSLYFELIWTTAASFY